ncbi:MAG TPA: hypothetical protein VMG81_05465 [Thermoplasmata archaeon]|nr:hypothetical protein [Thermoplasmata archaeon]
MGSSGPLDPPPAEYPDPPGSPRERAAKTALLLGIAIAFLVLCLQTPLLATPVASPLLFVGVLVEASLAFRWSLHRDRYFVAAWVGFALALAVASILTGYLNGLTDEGYATPEFARLYPNLYGTTLTLSQNHVTYAYIYLPLLPLLQIPGLDYRWITLASWAATVYLLRSNRFGAVVLGAPWVAVLAANGFNDFVPMVFVTLTLVTLSGRWARLTEVVALGLKQFANGILVVYYLLTRRWWEAAFAAAVTAAFLIPFAFLDASGVVCHALLLNAAPDCAGGFGVTSLTDLVSHLNYWAWPLLVLAIFAPRYARLVAGPSYAPERARVARWLGRSEYPIAGRSWSLLLVPLARIARRGPG